MDLPGTSFYDDSAVPKADSEAHTRLAKRVPSSKPMLKRSKKTVINGIYRYFGKKHENHWNIKAEIDFGTGAETPQIRSDPARNRFCG